VGDKVRITRQSKQSPMRRARFDGHGNPWIARADQYRYSHNSGTGTGNWLTLTSNGDDRNSSPNRLRLVSATRTQRQCI